MMNDESVSLKEKSVNKIIKKKKISIFVSVLRSPIFGKFDFQKMDSKIELSKKS